MATVTVTLIAPDGQRHAVTVEAKSLYTAIFQYNYLAPPISELTGFYDLVVVTGNGTPDAASYDGATEFSMSILQLSPALSLVDWYTPADYAIQNTLDTDLGSSHPMLIPTRRAREMISS